MLHDLALVDTLTRENVNSGPARNTRHTIVRRKRRLLIQQSYLQECRLLCQFRDRLLNYRPRDTVPVGNHKGEQREHETRGRLDRDKRGRLEREAREGQEREARE